jgi:hypothetical protein
MRNEQKLHRYIFFEGNERKKPFSSKKIAQMLRDRGYKDLTMLLDFWVLPAHPVRAAGQRDWCGILVTCFFEIEINNNSKT